MQLSQITVQLQLRSSVDRGIYNIKNRPHGEKWHWWIKKNYFLYPEATSESHLLHFTCQQTTASKKCKYLLPPPLPPFGSDISFFCKPYTITISDTKILIILKFVCCWFLRESKACSNQLVCSIKNFGAMDISSFTVHTGTDPNSLLKIIIKVLCV